MAHYPGGAAPYPGAPDPNSFEWSVSITDDDQRTMTAAQILAEYQRGTLDLQDTFVWRDGMQDWVPLGQAPELAALVGQPAPSGGGYAPGPSDPPEGLGSTVMMDSPMDVAPPPDVAAPAARLGGGPGVDVFEQQSVEASAAPGRRGPPRRVGERNEASALFSLDQIKAEGSKRGAAKAPAAGDDLMGLGSGFGGGGIASSAFEPPPLNAPVLTPPPQPKLPPQVEAQLLAAAQPDIPPPKSKAPIIAVAAVAGILIFGVITLVLVMRSPEEQPTALNSDGSTSTSASETPSDTDEASPSGADTSTATEAATADATADPSAEADSKSGSSSRSGSSSSSGSGSSSSKGSKTDDKKDTSSKTDDKKDTSAPDAKTAEPAPAGGEFNRDAASAAMGSAAGAASGCGKPGGPTGRGRVSVTFAPSGRATNVSVGPPFGGTSVGSCIASAFKRVSVPPFSGGAITVSKSVTIR